MVVNEELVSNLQSFCRSCETEITFPVGLYIVCVVSILVYISLDLPQMEEMDVLGNMQRERMLGLSQINLFKLDFFTSLKKIP